MYVVGPVDAGATGALGVGVVAADADGALVVGLIGGGCEKTPGGKARVGVAAVDAWVEAVGEAGEVSVEVIPVAGAITGPGGGMLGMTTALVVATGAGVLRIVTFWGGGADSGPAGFSRVHPRATIANNASVAKK